MVSHLERHGVTQREEVRLRRKIRIIAVIFRWIGVLLLISGAIGLATFLWKNDKLWMDATFMMAGVTLVVSVPYFLVTWSFLRGGVRLTKFERSTPRCNNSGHWWIGLSFFMGLKGFLGISFVWRTQSSCCHHNLGLDNVFVRLGSNRFVLENRGKIIFAESPCSPDTMGGSQLQAEVEEVKPAGQDETGTCFPEDPPRPC